VVTQILPLRAVMLTMARRTIGPRLKEGKGLSRPFVEHWPPPARNQNNAVHFYNAQGPQTGDVHLRIRSRLLIHGFDLGCKGREFLLELLHELGG